MLQRVEELTQIQGLTVCGLMALPPFHEDPEESAPYFEELADLAARTIVEPAELPIGVVTAFLGAPFFVLVLRTSRRSVW